MKKLLILAILAVLVGLGIQVHAYYGDRNLDFKNGEPCVIVFKNEGHGFEYFRSVANALKAMNDREMSRAKFGDPRYYTKEKGFIGLFRLVPVDLRTSEKAHITKYLEFKEAPQ